MEGQLVAYKESRRGIQMPAESLDYHTAKVMSSMQAFKIIKIFKHMHTNRNRVFQELNRLCYSFASKIFWKHKGVKMLPFAGHRSAQLCCQYIETRTRFLGGFSSQFFEMVYFFVHYVIFMSLI